MSYLLAETVSTRETSRDISLKLSGATTTLRYRGGVQASVRCGPAHAQEAPRRTQTRSHLRRCGMMQCRRHYMAWGYTLVLGEAPVNSIYDCFSSSVAGVLLDTPV